MHVLLATLEDTSNKNSWSGTPYAIHCALRRSFTRVTVLKPKKPARTLFNAISRVILGAQKYPIWMTKHALDAYAELLNQEVKANRPDIVISISMQYLVCFDWSCSVPVITVCDAPYKTYRNAYSPFESIPLLTNQYARLEANVAKKAASLVFPTSWACAEAIEAYGVDKRKVYKIPFGANLASSERSENASRRISSKPYDAISLLFVGKDWRRKGGDFALEVLRQLILSGAHASLTVVGCDPNIPEDLKLFVDVKGFLSASDPMSAKALDDLYRNSTYFLVPSRAECYGLVYAEAQSYGLPCVAFCVHGVPSVIDDGVSGLLFALNSTPKDFAARMRDVWNDANSHRLLSLNARKKFENELNWDRFGGDIFSLASKTVSTHNFQR